MFKIKNCLRNITFILLVLCSISLSAQEKLVFAVTLIRHGDRTPVHGIVSDPYKWTNGLGELTPHGMNQEYLLGTKLRKRYITQYKLLPPKYLNNSVYVRSTDFNRTIMSAESFLAAFYPLGTGPMMHNNKPALPAAQQPIPLRTLPKDQDYLLLAKDNYIKQFNKMGDKYVFTTSDWKEKNSKYSGDFERWSKIFGEQINNLRDLVPIGDNLNVRMLNDVPMPKGVSEKEAKEIIKIARWAQAQAFRPRRISCFIAKVFLDELGVNLQKAVDNKQTYKYILYSAHDSTVMPVISAIGVPLDSTPPYASNISFELFKTDENYYVNVRYNGKDIKLPDINDAQKCSFEEFKKIILPRRSVIQEQIKTYKTSNPETQNIQEDNTRKRSAIYPVKRSRQKSQIYDLNNNQTDIKGSVYIDDTPKPAVDLNQ
jgi:lysosomal acid phosphatase